MAEATAPRGLSSPVRTEICRMGAGRKCVLRLGTRTAHFDLKHMAANAHLTFAIEVLVHIMSVPRISHSLHATPLRVDNQSGGVPVHLTLAVHSLQKENPGNSPETVINAAG